MDADVDMPILSGSVLCSDGGSLAFNQTGGMVHNPNGEKDVFVKRRGVYFMKLWIPKEVAALPDVGFVRPRTA